MADASPLIPCRHYLAGAACSAISSGQGRSAMKKAMIWLALGCVAAMPAAAQTFFAGKSIDMLIGADAGGGYDIAGRVMARSLGRHSPGNPAIVGKNMAGATGLTMINYLANAAAKDGTVIGLSENNIAYEPLLGTATG